MRSRKFDFAPFTGTIKFLEEPMFFGAIHPILGGGVACPPRDCILCWMKSDARLARDELMRYADDGGRVP